MKNHRMVAAFIAAALLVSASPTAFAAEVNMCPITRLGDADDNGSVTVADAVCLSRSLVNHDTQSSANADLTADGNLNAFDLGLLKRMLLGTYVPEDFTGLVINEVCASNEASLTDASGNAPDWIEIHNTANTDVCLDGYGLSDGTKNLFKYTFPTGTVIPAHGYLVVFCDDAVTEAPGEHHAAFKLSASGESVYLTHPACGTLDAVDVPAAETDVTYGRFANGKGSFTLLSPTPGASNDTATAAIDVMEPVFSHESGFYDSGFELSMVKISGTIIRYTTDGSDPRISDTAAVCTGVIPIYNNTQDPNVYSAITDIALSETSAPNFSVDKGMVIRAVCVDADGNYSDVVTKNYFVEKNAAYYKSMKVISIVTDPDNLFDPQNGIYVVGDNYYAWRNSPEYDPTLREWDTNNPTNYNQSGIEWERPANVQIFEDGTLAYESNVGIRIAGNATRSNPQKSIRLYARSEYGDSKMNYPFFDGLTDASGNAITAFDKVTIRNSGNDINDARFRDELVQSLACDLDLSTQAAADCILFIDGEFWGLYSLKERLEDDYVESHYGIDKKNVTTLKNYEWEGDEAIFNEYVEFYQWALASDMTDDANYQRVCDTIDMQSFMDYITLETYICNWDWANSGWTNNWQLWRSNTVVEGNEYGDGKWRYMLFDTEYSSGLYNAQETAFYYDMLGNLYRKEEWGNIGALFYKLLENETFKTQFAENYRARVENDFDYDTKVAPLIDAYAAAQKDAACVTWRRFNGSYGDRLASNYDNNIRIVREFYRNRATYALRFLDQLIGK